MMVMQVANGIHRLTQGVSNFYLVEDGGKLTLVDAGAAGDWGLLIQALDELGRKPEDLEAVLVTHAHSDHTGFAERARTEADSAVWIHEADAAAAKGAKPPKNEASVGRYLIHAEAYRTLVGLLRHRGMKVVPIREVSTFADGETIDVPGRPRVAHVPGHTPGMSALFFEGRRALMTGDALVLLNPLTGRKGPQIAPSGLNRDSKQALASLDSIAALTADIVLPGHGDPWTDGVADAVRRAKAAGFS
jgi:glyoxylase-like metal-dependent hydrolase (beta-lactamase superfamily II)